MVSQYLRKACIPCDSTGGGSCANPDGPGQLCAIRAARGDPDVAQFPSLKARQLLPVLTSEPLGYRIVRQAGSHRRLQAPGRPTITFSFHDRKTIRPATVNGGGTPTAASLSVVGGPHDPVPAGRPR
jgi:predicted RNA binding protein YcfA (HicA-like mRNA interferase family)